MPTLHEVAANFQHEAFPLPFPLLLRLYTGLFGENDVSLRCFGLLVGLAVLIVAWLNSRISGRAGPIVGGARPPEEGLPTTLGPPPHPQLGWAGYVSFWSIELGTFLSEHVAEGEIVIDKPQSNIKAEDVPLLVGRGWRD
jgi:hypothetical protein